MERQLLGLLLAGLLQLLQMQMEKLLLLELAE